jgi:caffeoyl-CoA O-methyltransferase
VNQAGRQKGMNPKISRMLESLGRQSERQKSGELTPKPEREMIAITPDTGVFYSILLRAIGATNVLEIGTSSGYSSLWFANALFSSQPRVHPSIITIESNPDKVEWARENFRKAGVQATTKIIEGEAVKVLRKLKNVTGKFDFVFIDADKENIITYFDLVFPMVRQGGIIAADNMLFPEHFRPLMKKYSSYLARRADVQTVTVPIGMGEEITVKIR